MIYRVEHQTKYSYSESAVLSYNDVCLDLRACPNQTVRSSVWRIVPEPQVMRQHNDFFGNAWRTLAFEQAMGSLSLTVVHEVEVVDPDPCLGLAADAARTGPEDLQAYLWASPYVDLGPGFADYAAPSFAGGRDAHDAALDLTRRVFADFRYSPRATVIGTRTGELLAKRRGVCQDYAHFMIACLRSRGVPARYVSGYLNTLPKPGQDKVFGADASHAWVSVRDPVRGWRDFDPTNGVAVRDGHITIAWGRDYGDVSPMRGVILGGGGQSLEVLVDVRALG